MAAYNMASVFRACSKCSQMMMSLAVTNARSISHKINNNASSRLLSTSQYFGTQSQSTTGDSENQHEYPCDYEVSHSEFKYVEQVLPRTTVPAYPIYESYPTPSGWLPPIDTLKSQHPFLVRRTKNHILPVYSKTRSSWFGTSHKVTVKKIEGDIWAMESELRRFLQKRTGLSDIKTQVQEVSRQIRISGLHAPLVAEFLLACGM